MIVAISNAALRASPSLGSVMEAMIRMIAMTISSHEQAFSGPGETYFSW
ncbi:MAG: hypothetical protein R2724_16520 [Bryobacterales bacterium]